MTSGRPALGARDDATGCRIVKLGGSLITTTDTAGQPRVDEQRLTRLAEEIAATGLPTVLVHGTGTFGKPAARRHDYLDGVITTGRQNVFAQVSTLLARLEISVLEALQRGGLCTVRVPLSGLCTYSCGEIRLLNTDSVRLLLDHGITPVLGGNLAWGVDGFAVYSSDILAADLAIPLHATGLIMATNASGVHLDHGASDRIHRELNADNPALTGSISLDRQDVSGGMRAKVRECGRTARNGIPTFIVDGRLPGNITAALSGEPHSGTRVRADGPPRPGGLSPR
ncbi:isopentenyl phosphate kinase [Streptomyces anulatus]|uniref:isopentenyl phosphate kinase n=1 Tax=Streptomyces anulatus TaxID=1892 RepID=UPI00386E2BBC|nr:isopentenyl phosphate kinase [Streptomyces anulatus]